MKTGDVLVAMLTENTGIHMLDSGGAYGRGWQENKGRDFAGEPAATISVKEGFIDIRRSTYHFLKECLEFDEAMNDRFGAFNRAEDPGDQIPWLALMEEFAESIEATGIYGEGPPITRNTYNHDSLLDQVIQYIYFELDERGYVLLQLGSKLHTAYTAPKAFRCNIEASQSISSDGEAVVVCKDANHRWYIQDGDWEIDHYQDLDKRGLDKFPIMAMGANYHKVVEKGKVAEGAAYALLWQDAEGVHCPLCGGVLEVW